MTLDNDIGVSAQPSLQDLLDQAQSEGLLPRSKLAGARSAVAALASFLGRSATSIPGHQGFVIAQMKRMRKAPSKLSKKTMSNYRTELLGLIRATRGRGPKSPQALS